MYGMLTFSNVDHKKSVSASYSCTKNKYIDISRNSKWFYECYKFQNMSLIMKQIYEANLFNVLSLIRMDSCV